MTARVAQLNRGPEIRPATSLRQRLAGIEQARSNDGALLQKMRDRVICSSSLSDRRKPCHKAIPEVVGGSHDKICGWIGQVLGTKREARDVRVSVDEPRHNRLTGNVDRRYIGPLNRLARHRFYAITCHEDVACRL